MSDFLTLTCPTCGAKLKVTDQIHLLACANCGNEHMVHRDGGAIYLAPIAQDVRQIRIGVDKTAAELAVARLSKEIDNLEAELRAAEARSDEGWVGPPDDIKGLGVIGVIAIILALAFNSNGYAGIGVLLVIGALVAFGFAIKQSNDRATKIRTMRERKIKYLNGQLSVRYEQYRTNRKIAES